MNTSQAASSKRVLRLPAVESRTGRKKTSIYWLIARGEFPAPIPIGARARGWLESEVEAWIEAQTARRNNGQVA
jgi:prophage regulatory protein